MSLFAQIREVSSTEIGAFVVVFTVAGGLYFKVRGWENQLKGHAEKREVGPQPFMVKEAVDHASKHDLEALDGRMGKEILQLHGRISTLRKEVSAEVSQLDKSLDEQTKELNKRIDAIPARVISLLKETRDYHATRT